MKYRNLIFLMLTGFVLLISACSQEEFEDAYTNPAKIPTSSVEKQYAGFVASYRDYVVPSYWNYFVVLRPTVNRYTQVVGWVNDQGQYVPGAGLVGDRWSSYYNMVAQYRELERIYAGTSAEDQAARNVFMITAKIFLYDQTQKVIDLHGDIPFSKAGLLSTNGGNYTASYPSYDDAEGLYVKMLDDLKSFAGDLNTISIQPAVQTGFTTQDIINGGDIGKWKIYCNSLRVRMLMRASGVASLKSRAESEMKSILDNPTTYPVIVDHKDNIQIKVFNTATAINANGFRTGLEDWNGNIAGKAMIDHMTAANDPRLRVMFEPGANASGVYKGLDQAIAPSIQQSLIDGGTLSIYNRSTFSRNQYFPGILINAAEIHFLKAEYYLKSGNDSEAKAAYNLGIEQSVKGYYTLRSLTSDDIAGAITPTTDSEITAYEGVASVSWDNAATLNEKLTLIATQKWIHYSVVQPLEGWAEQRRMDLPQFVFLRDISNNQELPPVRWPYANSEVVYNAENYSAVRAKDNLSTRIFWDLN